MQANLRTVMFSLALLTQAALYHQLSVSSASAQPFPAQWQARWIWDDGEGHPYHYFLMARKTFDLGHAPREAVLKITASDRYMLYMNGKYIGRGPARSDPRWKSYDVHDLTSVLKPGRNVIAVLAYHYGCQNAYSRDERAGLFAQLEITGSDGKHQIVGTDETWRVRHAEAWRRDVDLVDTAVGVTEVYDARLDPADWNQPAFDDASWKAATVIAPSNSPWIYLDRRRTPQMKETEIFPQRVESVGEILEVTRVINGQGPALSDTQVPERLMSDVYMKQQFSKIQNSETLLGNKSDNVATFQSFPTSAKETADEGDRSPYIIVDFGRPVFGFPRIELEGPSLGVVEMSYGPHLVNGKVLPIMQGVRYGDRYVMRDGRQTWQVHEYKQFRYLQLVFRDIPASVRVHSLSLVDYTYPAKRIGSFECSSPVFGELWKACIRTNDLGMEDVLVCDPIRERRVFTGDGSHGNLAILAAYGDQAISDWYFRLVCRGPTIDGMLRLIYPGTESAHGDGSHRRLKEATVSENPENIPQHGLVFTATLGEYYRQTCNLDLIREVYPALVRFAGWCKRFQDKTGLLYDLPYWNWADWTETRMDGSNFETNAFYYGMMRDLAMYATALNHPDDAKIFQTRADNVRDQLRAQHWNASKGMYADCVVDGKQVDLVTENANGLALFFDIATSEQIPGIIEQIADPKTQIVRGSPLFFYYTLEGLMRHGGEQVALDEMAKRYGPMLKVSNVPTIWERWEQAIGKDWAQIHNGAVGPALTLSKHVLGVEPVGAGFEKCRIAPCTGNLEAAHGVVPTVRGPVAVEWSRQGAAFEINVDLPDGLETQVSVPTTGEGPWNVQHNDQRLRLTAESATPGYQVKDGRVIASVRGGKHRLRVE